MWLTPWAARSAPLACKFSKASVWHRPWNYLARYKPILVEKDNYLLELARYVVLNPVRAGM